MSILTPIYIYLIYVSKNKPPIGFVEDESLAKRAIENIHLTHSRHGFWQKVKKLHGYEKETSA